MLLIRFECLNTVSHFRIKNLLSKAPEQTVYRSSYFVFMATNRSYSRTSEFAVEITWIPDWALEVRKWKDPQVFYSSQVVSECLRERA